MRRPTPSIAGRALNPQFRRDFGRFLADGGARTRSLWLTLIAAAVLLLTWPYHPVLDLDQGPFTYTAVGTVIVFIAAYLGLILGIRAEPAEEAGQGVQEWAAYVPLPIHVYLRGTLAGRMGDVLLFLLVAAPVLASAAALEGVPVPQLGGAAAVLLITGFSGRAMALLLMLWLEDRPVRLILAAHGALVALFVIGGVLWPPLSPLRAFYAAHEPAAWGLAQWIAAPWPGMIVTHGMLVAAAYGLCWGRVRQLRRRADGLEASERPPEAAP